MSRAACYEVRIKASAEREMNRLSANVAGRIVKAILSLETSPRPRGCRKLRGRVEYRLRAGNYRILYVVNDTTRTVEVMAVGHRKDVYR
ncbi:MAG: type II toxin-antitoxin system RelE/ParE family toxin [Phycisphaerae bacterium]|nr:type II toxin-antitoxin system RelE/ParE family toxin [Phycisphaerae bacterium]